VVTGVVTVEVQVGRVGELVVVVAKTDLYSVFAFSIQLYSNLISDPNSNNLSTVLAFYSIFTLLYITFYKYLFATIPSLFKTLEPPELC